MQLFETIRRILDALATAAGVVLGLVPDPTAVPVEHDDPGWR
jgi:hypothetical protein